MEEKVDRRTSSHEGNVERGIWGKVKRVAGLITIEPTILFQITSLHLGEIFMANFLIYKACHVNLGYNDTTCESIVDMPGEADRSDIEEKAQEIVAETQIWSSVIDNIFPILYVIFLGAWSDTYGWKFPYLVTMLGAIVSYGFLMLATYFTSWNTQIVALVEALPMALTGSRTAINMIVFSYITETTSVRDRTLKMGIATAMETLGKSLGSTGGGQMANAGLGYYWGFGTAGGLRLAGFIWTLIFLKDTRGKGGVVLKKSNFVAIFDLRHVRDSFQAFFRKRENGHRGRLFLLVTALTSATIPLQPEGTLLYKFTRIQVGWDAGKFGIFNTVNVIMGVIGRLASAVILSHLMGLSDAIIGVFGSISQISSSCIFAFASEDWMMYLATVVDMLNGVMIVSARSMISKMIPRDETGKVNGVIAVISKLSTLPMTPIYNLLYRDTLDTFAGAIFLLSVAVTLPGLLIFMFLACSSNTMDRKLSRDKSSK